MSDPSAFDMDAGKRWAEEFGRGIRKGVPEAEAAARELSAAVARAMLEQEIEERVVREQVAHVARNAKQKAELDRQLDELRVSIIGDSSGWERALGVRQTWLRSVLNWLRRGPNQRDICSRTTERREP